MMTTPPREATEPKYFSKLGAALWQLDRAIALFLDEADYACAITLAGAADEILGKLLNAEGKTHALGQFVDLCMYIRERDDTPEVEPEPPFSRSTFASFANERRNELKHYTEGRNITITKGDAIEMLDRAVSNFQALTGTESPSILRYMAEARQ